VSNGPENPNYINKFLKKVKQIEMYNCILVLIFLVGVTNAKNFEGDIKVFRDQLEASYGKDYASKMHSEGYVVDDMRRRRRLGADANPRYHWPSGIVPYTFMEGHFTMSQKNQIEKHVMIMNDKVKPYVTFRPFNKSTDENYIVFKAGDGGCWSFVGMIGGPQTVNLRDPFCRELATVEHELMHAVGFWHEQSRYDRDEYVKVHYENIMDGLEGQFAKRNRLDSYGYKYDYNSIMHYGAKSFSKNGKDVLEAINPPGSKMGNWKAMSQSDVGQTRAMYGEKTKPSMSPTSSPTMRPTRIPTSLPTMRPTRNPSFVPCRKLRRKSRCLRHRDQCFWRRKNRRCYRKN
jgi:hypothetical protein